MFSAYLLRRAVAVVHYTILAHSSFRRAMEYASSGLPYDKLIATGEYAEERLAALTPAERN